MPAPETEQASLLVTCLYEACRIAVSCGISLSSLHRWLETSYTRALEDKVTAHHPDRTR